MKKLYQAIPEKLKNKWVLAPLVLFVWLLFFEDVNIISLIRAKSNISSLEKEWKYYEDKIEETKNKKALILSDVEKYARETYWMKKPNEEIFVFSKK